MLNLQIKETVKIRRIYSTEQSRAQNPKDHSAKEWSYKLTITFLLARRDNHFVRSVIGRLVALKSLIPSTPYIILIIKRRSI